MLNDYLAHIGCFCKEIKSMLQSQHLIIINISDFFRNKWLLQHYFLDGN